MFTVDYLRMCLSQRAQWSGKDAVLGDWYIDLVANDGDVVSRKDLGWVDFSSGRCAYVPDADDLLEFMDIQIRAWGDEPEKKQLKITYDPEDKWKVEIHYAGRITFAARQNSIHECLYRAFWQMIYFDPSLLSREGSASDV